MSLLDWRNTGIITTHLYAYHDDAGMATVSVVSILDEISYVSEVEVSRHK